MPSVYIRWGSEQTQEETYDKGGEKPSLYEFETQAELNAFLCGVEAAAGWTDYTIVDEGEQA